jgi:hypothetical protein
MWVVNGEWNFLWKGLDRWMRSEMPAIAQKLQEQNDALWEKAGEENDKWNTKIQIQERLKTARFIAADQLPHWDDTPGARGNEEEVSPPVAFDLAALPYRPASRPVHAAEGKTITVGAVSSRRVTTGGSGGQIQGARYGRVIHMEDVRGRLSSLRFHLQYNLCSEAHLKIYLYGLENDAPAYSLMAAPIDITIGDETGWIERDLRNYELYPEDDVLMILEIGHCRGKGKEQGGLFFSHSGGSYSGLKNHSFSPDFTEFGMAANFEVERGE